MGRREQSTWHRRANLVSGSCALAIFASCLPCGNLTAAELADSSRSVRRPFGIEKRIPWTTSRIHGTPEPPRPYRMRIAFPKLKFSEPLAMCIVPGTNRLAVVERHGKIYTFENDPQTATKDLLVDAGRTVYGLAFHPDFLQNGYIFTMSTLNTANPAIDGSRISRFTVRQKDPPSTTMDSEKTIFSWPFGGHNGGCLGFGPDGYLYFSTGDGSGIADQLQTGQNIGDVRAALLRIDVDRAEGDRAYGIPSDNPFANTPGASPEIYAYGLRQLWKFSFDTATGRLWGGEVGQDLWEMIYLIQKGGNYGWSVMEGAHPFRPDRKKGPTPFIAPIIEHSHNDFRSITAGYVYHGRRLPQLEGALIYGDYDTGRIWSFRYDGKTVTDHQELADTQLRIVGFGQDRQGEVYLIDFVGGALHQLEPAPPTIDESKNFPRKLSETGLFDSTKDHTPVAGLIPYSVNSPLYSDNAKKLRYLALPGDSQIEFDTVTYPLPDSGAPPAWRFPDGTVLVKTFSLEMEVGNPDSLRRLETRILHHERMPGNENEYGAQVWRGYTYLWNDEQTDANLLDASGLNRTYTITDPSATGGKREQTWRFPSRAECTLCHTMSAKYVLGVSTLQMNKDHDYDGVIANQLQTLDHLGVFTKPLPETPYTMPQLADYRDESLGTQERARAYLHANCSHCHRQWGGGNAEFVLLATYPLALTKTVDVRPGQGLFDLEDPRLVVPGSPERSMIHHRMKILGLGRMPHIASSVLDKQAVKLIGDWIREMPQTDR